MADMRSCIKTGCRWPAAATLSYRYATAEVWLSDLGEHHPATHDLCPHHADALRIPRGWTLIDDRRPAEAVREPSAAEIVERVTTLRRSVDAMLEAPAPARTRRSRYESLLDSLPTYDPPEDEPTAAAPAAVPPAVPPAVLVPVGVSHEMAPIVRELARAHPVLPVHAGPIDAGPADAGPADAEPADAGPADPDVVHRTGLRGAVVLSLPLRTPGGDDGEAG
jgi:hypothetical protein